MPLAVLSKDEIFTPLPEVLMTTRDVAAVPRGGGGGVEGGGGGVNWRDDIGIGAREGGSSHLAGKYGTSEQLPTYFISPKGHE